MEGSSEVQINPVREAAEVVRSRWGTRAKLAMILGTGMGQIADDIQIDAEFDYGALPHFRTSTAIGHRGRLLCGSLRGVSVVAMDGRFHVYEGYSQDEVSFPVRVMSELGAESLLASNAAGALNPQYQVGDLMILDDHINLLGGLAFNSSTQTAIPRCRIPYDSQFVAHANVIANSKSVRTHRGVYVAVSGPNYETPAECRYLRRIGGDAVGMSTAPEAVAALERGMRTLAFSIITNVCAAPTDGHDVIASAQSGQHNVRALVSAIVDQIRTADRGQ